MRRSWTHPMWQNLPLRGRINLLLALGLALGLAVNIARLVSEAGPRVQAEDQSVIRLARAFIETIVADLNDATDPDAKLRLIAGNLNRLRHVSITRQDDAAGGQGADRITDADDLHAPPAWFVSLVHPEKTSVSVPLTVNGSPESLVITSHPNDEIAEIWDGILTQLVVGSALAVALFLVMMIVIGRALKPLEALSQAMTSIEAGAYDVRVKPEGAPELAGICAKLNHLAGALSEAMEDNRRHAQRAVSLQDLERKQIARELHDEFGPYLFSLRAHASALVKLAEARNAGVDALKKHGSAILQRSMPCNSSTGGCWSGCGRSDSPSLGCAARLRRCFVSGPSHVLMSPSKPAFRVCSERPAKPPN